MMALSDIGFQPMKHILQISELVFLIYGLYVLWERRPGVRTGGLL